MSCSEVYIQHCTTDCANRVAVVELISLVFWGQYAIVRRLGRCGMRQSLEISETCWIFLEGQKERERFGDLVLGIRLI